MEDLRTDATPRPRPADKIDTEPAIYGAVLLHNLGVPEMEFADDTDFEIEFRWKEEVIYWEGTRGCVFLGGWGVDPPVTIVPDDATWDRAVPGWLHGRHDEVVARLRARAGHVVQEERDDSAVIDRYPEITR